MARRFQRYLRKLRRSLDKRVDRDADAGSDGYAEVAPFGVDCHENRRGSVADDDERAAVQLLAADRRCDKIGADFARPLGIDRHELLPVAFEKTRFAPEITRTRL